MTVITFCARSTRSLWNSLLLIENHLFYNGFGSVTWTILVTFVTFHWKSLVLHCVWRIDLRDPCNIRAFYEHLYFYIAFGASTLAIHVTFAPVMQNLDFYIGFWAVPPAIPVTFAPLIINRWFYNVFSLSGLAILVTVNTSTHQFLGSPTKNKKLLKNIQKIIKNK